MMSEDFLVSRRIERIQKIAEKAHGYPSFTGLLQVDLDQEEPQLTTDNNNLAADDEDEVIYLGTKLENQEDQEALSSAKPPPKSEQPIIIDVDVELGLKQRPAPPPDPVVSSRTTDRRLTPSKRLREARDSVRLIKEDPEPAVTLLPVDEGYYEGVVSPIGMKEDVEHLSPAHVWLRQQLEFFSATKQVSRKVPRGRLGIRCIHCQKQHIDHQMQEVHNHAAVSYPVHMGGVYSVSIQKPYLHFTKCPALPPEERVQFQQLWQREEDDNRRFRGKFSLTQYYVLSAKRIGIVETTTGLRFGRDLSLQPLPLQSVIATASVASSIPGVSPLYLQASEEDQLNHTRVQADEESERVLAQSLALPDGLILASEKTLLTDFIFLLARQMVVCHVIPYDINMRGRRSKGLTVGFAGFGCRHCAEPNGLPPFMGFDTTCRNFPTTSETLSSSVSQSFYQHLLKCYKIPPDIPKALKAYKRLHQRQMVYLQHGSQKRFYELLFTRLREKDKTADEMKEIIEEYNTAYAEAMDTNTAKAQRQLSERSGSVTSSVDNGPENVASMSGMVPDILEARPQNFPVVSDPSVAAILLESEKDWDGAQNSGLVLPQDKGLISDYVFLTMRQITLAHPEAFELHRIRRSQADLIPGICCLHCMGKDPSLSPSGRCFPSAPDNFASALNSSMYSHMQKCSAISNDLKHALALLKKIHSQQCSSLRFGAQRRYFNLLFARLRNQRIEYNFPEPSEVSSAGGPSRILDLNEFDFIELNSSQGPLLCCKKCFQVPVVFRVPNSVVYSTFSKSALKIVETHARLCTKDLWDISPVSNILREVAADINTTLEALCNSDAFQQLMKMVLKAEDIDALCSAFVSEDFMFKPSSNMNGALSVDKDDVQVAFESLKASFQDIGDGTFMKLNHALSLLGGSSFRTFCDGNATNTEPPDAPDTKTRDLPDDSGQDSAGDQSTEVPDQVNSGLSEKDSDVSKPSSFEFYADV